MEMNHIEAPLNLSTLLNRNFGNEIVTKCVKNRGFEPTEE